MVRRYVGDVVSGTGVQDQGYVGIDALDTFFPFAVNLDPDHLSFWTAGEVIGEVFRFAIDGDGTPSCVFCGKGSIQLDCSPDVTTPPGWFGLGGLAIVGEPTAALSAVHRLPTPRQAGSGVPIQNGLVFPICSRYARRSSPRRGYQTDR